MFDADLAVVDNDECDRSDGDACSAAAAEELGVRLRREVRAARSKAIGDLRDGNNLYAVAQIHGIADDRADINKILYLFD